MRFIVYVLLVGGLVGAWLLVIYLFERSLVVFVATIVIMSTLIALAMYLESNGTDHDE